MPLMTVVPATTQDQTFWRNWNLYCCDQDHGQPSTSNLIAPTSTPAVSTICADQACDIQAFCCSEAVCPAVDLPLHVEVADECCVDPHVECFDEDCLGGREVLQATTCDDPACGVEDFACMDEDCRFLQEYLSCCGVRPTTLSTPAQHNVHQSSHNNTSELMSPTSFDALLKAALPLVDHSTLPTLQSPSVHHGDLGHTRASASSASSILTNPSPPQQILTKQHTCHWQNCHELFDSVQSLLAHISVKHLETEPPAELMTGLEVIQNRSDSGQLPHISHTGLSNGLLMDHGSCNAMDMVQGGGQMHDFKTPDGLVACLWDDCLPVVNAFDGFDGPAQAKAHLQGQLDFGLSGQPPHNRPLSITHGNLLSGDVSQSTTPVDPHGASPLDSATAVLKHLLQQHLGMDVTQGLLDTAAAHASGSASASGQLAHEMTIPLLKQDNREGKLHDYRHPGHHHHNSARGPKPGQLQDYQVSTRPERPSKQEKQINNTHAHICHWYDCEERFGSLAELTDHLSECHVGKGKTEYECLWSGCVSCDCDETSGEGQEGECEHVRAMQPNGPQTSGRKFASRQKIMRHLQSHTGYRPFICSVCKQGFSEQATLQSHFQRHAREKPFECDHPGCEKAFSVAASLSIHKRTHGGGKIYECPICQRGFVESSNLTKHIRTHTGERPHICAFPGCTKRFSRPDQLKRHARTHNRDKTHKPNKGTKHAPSTMSPESTSPFSPTA